MKASTHRAGVLEQDAALPNAAGQTFQNVSQFTLRDLRTRPSLRQLEADFRAWLDGFSSNLQDILDSSEFRNRIPGLSQADALGTAIKKLTSPDSNLRPDMVTEFGRKTLGGQYDGSERRETSRAATRVNGSSVETPGIAVCRTLGPDFDCG